MRIAFLLCCLATLLIAVSDCARASWVYPASYVQMFCSFEADSLVRGRVLDSEALYLTRDLADQWGRTYQGLSIFTRYRLTRAQLIHGDPIAGRLDVHLPGGQVGDIERLHSAAFKLEPGWEIVLFLQYDALNDLYYSAGTAQTVFLVLDGGERELLVNLRDYQKENIEDLRDLPVQESLALDEPIRQRPGRLITYSDLVTAFEAWPGCPPDSIADEADIAPR